MVNIAVSIQISVVSYATCNSVDTEDLECDFDASKNPAPIPILLGVT